MTAQTNGAALSKGAVAQYRGATFLVSSKLTTTADVYPVYVVISANSIAAGDIGSLQFVNWSAAGPGSELRQLCGFGFKGVLGAEVLDFSESTDGSGTNSATTPRVLRFGVATGVFGF